jgi:exopolyphosphatase/guanosine-5'-triphosphate,3'-diphosphate pyrophosphatase
MSGETLAAIDVGTNSIHLVVARAGEGHSFEVLTREKEMVRLGSAGGDMKELAPDAIDRGVAALRRFRLLAEASDAPVTAVATSAIREAENGRVFIQRARDEAGVEVDVISGVEEARLIHLGVLQAVPVYDRRHLVVDIGGGSTEIVIGEGDTTLLSRSLKLGAIRLTRRFFKSDPLHPGAVDACRRYVSTLLVTPSKEAQQFPFEVAVGSSGTIESIAAMAAAARDDGPPPRTFNNFAFRRKELKRVMKALVEAPTVEARREIPGLDPTRSDIVLAGAIILEQTMRAFDFDELIVSDYALREGVLLDALERRRGSARHHLHDVRRRSVMHLVELCDEDPTHSIRSAELALLLFDATQQWHGLTDTERELLEASALLANVGLFVSHAKHHKHSYYVIRNSEQLAGFTDHEIEIIAQVARYHRKSEPRSKHPEFAALSESDQATVRTLAGILRVAISLDRTHSGIVRSLTCEETKRRIVIEVECEPDADPSLELYTAAERRGLLEQVLDRPIAFEAV